MRILLVEDHPRVRDVVVAGLRREGHVVTTADRVAVAQVHVRDREIDVAILDIGLPDGSGLDVCRAARAAGLDIPILVLTARNQVHERVDGLDAGADDYLAKPFSIAELAARIRALGRRGPRWSESIRTFGAITIDRDRRMMHASGAVIPLTVRELEIVSLLAWAEGRVVAREEILERIWGDATTQSSSSLEVLVARIRRKLAPHAPESIRTVRQVGYAWAIDRSKSRSADAS